MAAALTAAPVFALIDPKNPNVTVYERPPSSQAKAPGTFPELKQDNDHYWLVDFRHLASFLYTLEPAQPETVNRPVGQRIQTLLQPDTTLPDLPEPADSADRIPANVRALDGKRVCLRGYMLPVTLDEKGLAKEFLIIRSPLVCCYGMTPAPNEWVVVKMTGKGAVATQDVPLNFYGTLHVGAFYEDNVFAGLYRLDGEKVSAP